MKIQKKTSIIILGLFAFSPFFFSCNNELKVSVFEPLPNEVVQKYTLQDSLFGIMYQNIRKLADSVFISKSNSPQFSSLEYYSFYNSQKKYFEQFNQLKKADSTSKKWLQIFGKDIEKFKTDSLKFRNYILENDYHNFLEIEVEKVYEKLIWVNRNTFVDLVFKPKNGIGIRKISGYVYFLPKEEKFDSLEIYIDTDKNAFFSFSGYGKKEFRNSGLDTGNGLNQFENLPIEIIKQKFNIHFKIEELVVDDKYIDSNFENVPYFMIEALKGKYSFYSESYIDKYINDNYKNYIQFVSDSAFQNIKLNFPLESQFYEVGWEKYSELAKNKSEEKIE